MNQGAGGKFQSLDQRGIYGTLLAGYSYDVLNRLGQKNLFGGTTKNTAHTYDSANQLKTMENKLTPAGTIISRHTYTYDLAGNRLTHANQTAATASMSFTYNPIYELTAVTGAQTHSYAYDKVGNRTTADSISYVSNNLNQYTTVGGAALTYNFNGNLTQEPGASYVYDAENRLLQVTKGATVANYRYDGFNRRVSKEIGTIKTFYIHDGNEIVEERDAAGALVADYVLGPRTDEILTMTRTGQTYYYFYDGLGSVRQLTDASGAVIESYDYDVYGQPLTTSTVGNPAMFTGRWFDAESGLYYYRARYYSPTLGRFLQRDPIGYFDSMNLYQYAKNNPVNYIDPEGENPVIAGILLAVFLDYLYDTFAADYVNSFIASHFTCEEQEAIGFFALAVSNVRTAKNPLKAAKKVDFEGIYEFITKFGTKYVGQSKNVLKRLQQHLRKEFVDVKNFLAAKKTKVPGGKLQREIAEQRRIDQLGGIDKLENIRNPIGPDRKHLMKSEGGE